MLLSLFIVSDHMKTSITKIFTFEAAHQLPEHAGKCIRLHGHSYKLEVTISGPLTQGGSSDGMIMDFADLAAIVEKEVTGQWDHQFLNDLVPFRTTAENLAQEIFSRLKKAGLPLQQVRLWETVRGCATVTE